MAAAPPAVKAGEFLCMRAGEDSAPGERFRVFEVTRGYGRRKSASKGPIMVNGIYHAIVGDVPSVPPYVLCPPVPHFVRNLTEHRARFLQAFAIQEKDDAKAASRSPPHHLEQVPCHRLFDQRWGICAPQIVAMPSEKRTKDVHEVGGVSAPLGRREGRRDRIKEIVGEYENADGTEGVKEGEGGGGEEAIGENVDQQDESKTVGDQPAKNQEQEKMTLEQLQALKVKELRALLRKSGMDATGRKKQLVERLFSSMQEEEEEAEKETKEDPKEGEEESEERDGKDKMEEEPQPGDDNSINADATSPLDKQKEPAMEEEEKDNADAADAAAGEGGASAIESADNEGAKVVEDETAKKKKEKNDDDDDAEKETGAKTCEVGSNAVPPETEKKEENTSSEQMNNIDEKKKEGEAKSSGEQPADNATNGGGDAAAVSDAKKEKEGGKKKEDKSEGTKNEGDAKKSDAAAPTSSSEKKQQPSPSQTLPRANPPPNMMPHQRPPRPYVPPPFGRGRHGFPPFFGGRGMQGRGGFMGGRMMPPGRGRFGPRGGFGAPPFRGGMPPLGSAAAVAAAAAGGGGPPPYFGGGGPPRQQPPPPFHGGAGGLKRPLQRPHQAGSSMMFGQRGGGGMMFQQQQQQPKGRIISSETKLFRVAKECKYTSVRVRSLPDIRSAKLPTIIDKSKTFEINEIQEGSDGNIYLKLKDRPGWVFMYDFDETRNMAPVKSKVLLQEVSASKQLGSGLPFDGQVVVAYNDPSSVRNTHNNNNNNNNSSRKQNKIASAAPIRWCLATGVNDKQGWIPKDYVERMSDVDMSPLLTSNASNNQTNAPRASTSNAPTKTDAADDWTVHKTPEGREYFYNVKTQVTTWDKPACLLQGSSSRGGGGGSASASKSSVWQILYSQGKPYYYNTSTNKTQWSCPPELEGHK
eukprot:jgi/Bigna1/88869/estExt_fgenesh1_pg.C_390118